MQERCKPLESHLSDRASHRMLFHSTCHCHLFSFFREAIHRRPFPSTRHCHLFRSHSSHTIPLRTSWPFLFVLPLGRHPNVLSKSWSPSWVSLIYNPLQSSYLQRLGICFFTRYLGYSYALKAVQAWIFVEIPEIICPDPRRVLDTAPELVSVHPDIAPRPGNRHPISLMLLPQQCLTNRENGHNQGTESHHRPGDRAGYLRCDPKYERRTWDPFLPVGSFVTVPFSPPLGCCSHYRDVPSSFQQRGRQTRSNFRSRAKSTNPDRASERRRRLCQSAWGSLT